MQKENWRDQIVKVTSKDFKEHSDTREMLKNIKDKQWSEYKKKHKDKLIVKEEQTLKKLFA